MKNLVKTLVLTCVATISLQARADLTAELKQRELVAASYEAQKESTSYSYGGIERGRVQQEYATAECLYQNGESERFQPISQY